MKNILRLSTATMLAICVLSISLTAASAPNTFKSTPFKGRGKGQIVGLVPTQLGVEISAVGSGESTHLGRFEREEHILLNPETGTFTGTIEFTAANGDVLWCSVTGGFTGPGIGEGTYTITGGEGRFENATGSADFNVVQSDPVNFTFDFSGTIDTN